LAKVSKEMENMIEMTEDQNKGLKDLDSKVQETVEKITEEKKREADMF
jgi:hypothetical protein